MKARTLKAKLGTLILQYKLDVEAESSSETTQAEIKTETYARLLRDIESINKEDN